MKTYEITFITKEDLKDKPVKAILDSLNAKVTSVSSLGQKSFTYPIKKEKGGFYTAVNFEIEPEKLTDFNKKLALEEEILRFLLVSTKIVKDEVRSEKKELEVAPAKEIMIEPEKEIVEAPEAEIVKTKKKVEKKIPASVKTTAGKSKAVKELTEEPVSEEERMEALDKKLEELLKE